MKRQPATRRAAAAAALALCAAATITGCGAGQVSQTASQQSAVSGYQGRAGDVLVRDASIAFAGQASSGPVYRVGQAAQLQLTLVNQGDAADRLVSVSSPWAASVQVQGDPSLAPGRAVQAGGPPQAAAALSDRTVTITLTGLKGDINAGTNYPVTFTFQRGGVLAAALPVGYPTGPLAERGSTN